MSFGIYKIKPDEFPPLLNEIRNPPRELFIRGLLEKDEKCIAVVGTRKASSYGKRITFRIVSELAQLRMTIVSGLAYGIDTFAHEAAMRSKTRTIAVLACGLDQIYPQENRLLAEKIERNGAIISEYKNGTPPLHFHFPERNRIISGISIATIVVEAGEKSGALITAKHAINQGREVFTVPGDIDRPQCKGTLMLLKEGAHPFTSTQDLLENLNIQCDIITHIKQKEIKNLTREEQEVFDAIENNTETPIEDISRVSKFHISKIQSILSILEIRSLIGRTKTGMYIRL